MLSREEGKTLPEGIGEVARAGQIFKFFGGEALRLAGEKIRVGAPGRRRRGDARAGRRCRHHHAVEFSDRDSGLEDRAGAWPTATASCSSPRTSCPDRRWALADIIVKAGLPAGVFNLVMGRGSVVGETLIDDRASTRISFTGSVATGRAIAAKAIARMAKIQLEMGGKNPLVVLDDADLAVAVNCAVNGAFFSTGQRCTASSRLIVTAGIHDRFVAALTERLGTLKVDDALAPGTDIGPVVDEIAVAAESRLHRHRPARRRQAGVRRRTC